jgi:hypothetical protein
VSGKTLWMLLMLVCAGCSTRERVPTPPEPPPAVVEPATTRGEFTIVADKLDTWNAVGQIVVRTDGVVYEGRSQMLDLYSIRYREQPFILLTKALLLSDTIKNTTTLVTAATPAGKPIDTPSSAELLALLQRELPAEIESVKAKQAAAAKAKAQKAKKSKKAKKKSKK